MVGAGVTSCRGVNDFESFTLHFFLDGVVGYLWSCWLWYVLFVEFAVWLGVVYCVFFGDWLFVGVFLSS